MADVLKQTQNLPIAERLTALNRQAEQMLKMLKTDIVKGICVVDKGYDERLAELARDLGEFKSRSGSGSCQPHTVAGRAARNQLETARLRDLVHVATQLSQIEARLKSAPKDLSARTDLFVETQTLLGTFDNTKLENTELIKSYGYRLRAINPTGEIADKWLELVVLSESEITVPCEVGQLVASIGKLGKLDFFRAKIYPKLIDLVQSGAALLVESGATLKVAKRGDFVATVRATRDFARHLCQIGLAPDDCQAVKLRTTLIETYLKRNVPSDPAQTGEIKETIALVQSMAKFIERLDMGEVDKFASDLPSLIKKSKVAKTLESARQIITNGDTELFGTEVHRNSESATEQAEKSTSTDNRIATYFDYQSQLQFQATQFPISKRAAKLWQLMSENPAAAQMITILFISMMPELYQVRLETDYKLASLYYSDIEWMIGGLAELSHLNKFTELEKLTIVSLIPRLQHSARTIISIHLERLKNDIDEILTPQLSKLAKMEDQYIYDEVANTLEQSIAIVNIASDDMNTILPGSVAGPLIAQLVNHIGATLETRLVEMEDIPSDLCTPLDSLLALCATLPGKQGESSTTVVDDLRFVLRSSMLEIVAAFNQSEMKLTAAQCRALIRALFANTQHRQNSLAQIK